MFCRIVSIGGLSISDNNIVMYEREQVDIDELVTLLLSPVFIALI